MAASRKDLRKANERLVLKEIIGNGPLSRSQISRNLSLNKVTVSEILNDFISEESVIEVGTGNSTKSGGRRPTLLTINPKYGYFVCIDLGPDQIKIMSIYCNGIIQQFTEVKNNNYSIEEIIDLLITQIKNHQIEGTIYSLLGISIAFYGIVYHKKVSYSPFINLKGYELDEIFHKEFKVPIVVCNEANANAIYQRDFNFDDDCRNLICISLHKGVGAGIILNDKLYTGTRGEAGEIGNMIIRRDKQQKINRAEEFCSESNIIRKLRKSTKDPNLSLTQIAKAYNNPKIHATLKDFTRNLSDIINNVIVAYAPQKIIFVSELLEAIPNLLIDIRKNIHELTQHNTPLQISNNTKYSTQLGSYSLLLRTIFNLGDKKINLSHSK